MNAKTFFILIMLFVVSACAAPDAIENTGPAPTLPPSWTATPTEDAQDLAAAATDEYDLDATPTPDFDPEDQTIDVSQTYFGGADEWWLRIPQARLVHASGTSDGAMLLLLKLLQPGAEEPYTIVRMLPDGTIDWQLAIEGLRYPGGILETLDGGVLVTEFNHLYKLSADGSPAWSQAYSYSEIGKSVFSPIHEILRLGDRIQITGRFGDIVTVDREGFAIDVYQPSRIAHLLESDEAVAAPMPDGSYYGEQESRTVYRLARRSSEAPAWEVRFDFIGFDITLFPPYYVRGTRDGGALFIAPAPHLMADGGLSNFIVRLDRNGNVLWQQIYEGIYDGDFYAEELSDGGFIVTNRHTFVGRENEHYLRITRFNRSGYIVWDRNYGDGSTQIQVSQIIPGSSDGFFIVGQHLSGNEVDTGEGISILSVDPQGRILGCRYLTEISRSKTLGESPSVQTTSLNPSTLIRGELNPRESSDDEFSTGEIAVDFEVICSYPAHQEFAAEASEPVEARLHAFTDEEGQLIGGVQGNIWFSAEEVIQGLMPGSTYRLYNLSTSVGESTAYMGAGSSWLDCPGETFLDFVNQDTPAFRIALDAEWNAIPRIPTTHSSQIDTYTELLDDILKNNDVWNADLLIDDVVKVDIDGDGSDETFITANRNQKHMREGKVTKDDYSLLLFRRIGAEGVETIPLYERYETEDSSEREPVEIQLVAVIDLNGDGVMDLVAREEYYQTIHYHVFDLSTAEPNHVLSTTCAQLGGS